MNYFNQINLSPRPIYNFSNYFNSQQEVNTLKSQLISGSLKSSVIKGLSGIGVTHVLNAICNELKNQSKKVMYVTSECLMHITKKIRSLTDIDLFKKYILEFDVIAIDNIQFLYRKAKKYTQAIFDVLRNGIQSDKLIILGCSQPDKDITKSRKFNLGIDFNKIKLNELNGQDVFRALKYLCSPEDRIPDKLLYTISGYNGMIQQHINCLISLRFNGKMQIMNREELTVNQINEMLDLKKYFPKQQFRRGYIQTQLEFMEEADLNPLKDYFRNRRFIFKNLVNNI